MEDILVKNTSSLRERCIFFTFVKFAIIYKIILNRFHKDLFYGLSSPVRSHGDGGL
ncbi:hypothetical protein SAMN06264346_11737 [Chryseobacterium profundimaris]|uniref:Uncharacterized protein n=1 Tax=Chryseobacterium profundimaris TaxID=1387275 RepID=A0ABY1PH38_9FLAO|nr:hypothetical protein SAMN06264346_11737 [Chryseobacterium profundimaris]